MLFSAALLSLVCLTPQQPEAKTEPSATRPLRVITYNVHAWGPVAPTDEGRRRIGQMRSRGQLLRRLALELQLFDPDVIALQEAHSEAKVKELAALLEMDYAYFPGGWKGKGWEEGISGAILSRAKIIEREDRPSIDPAIKKDKLFSRCLGRAVIAHGGEEIAVFCAHMLPNWKNTTHIREAEIGALSVAAKKDLAKGRSVIVMGDMNHDPQRPEYRLWQQNGFVDTVLACKKDRARNTCPSHQPNERIDYVFAAGPVRQRLRDARALHAGAFLVQPSVKSSYALSDHIPVLAVFR